MFQPSCFAIDPLNPYFFGRVARFKKLDLAMVSTASVVLDFLPLVCDSIKARRNGGVDNSFMRGLDIFFFLVGWFS